MLLQSLNHGIEMYYRGQFAVYISGLWEFTWNYSYRQLNYDQ